MDSEEFQRELALNALMSDAMNIEGSSQILRQALEVESIDDVDLTALSGAYEVLAEACHRLAENMISVNERD